MSSPQTSPSTLSPPRPPFSTEALLASSWCRKDSPLNESHPHTQLLRHIACDYGTHALVLEALIETLIRKGVMSEDEFEEILHEIDGRDGRMDGTLGLSPTLYMGEGI